MMHASRSSQVCRWMLLALGLSTPVGCASVSKFPEKTPQQEATSEERAAEVVRDFERKRDEAQYAAAAQSLRKGDLKASQVNLEQLLTRNPQHRASRLLLAEVLVCQGQPQMAAMQLETARKHFVDDAEIEHTLALVRDSMDQHAVALSHYRRAAQLAPENQLFAASLQTAAAAPLTPLAAHDTQECVSATAGRPPQVATVAYQTEAAPIVNSPNRAASLPGLLPDTTNCAPLPSLQPAESSTGTVKIRFAEVKHLPLGEAMAAMQRPVVQAVSPLARADQLAKRGQQAIEAGELDAGMAYVRQAMAVEPQNPQIPISVAVTLLRRGKPIAAVDLMSTAAKSFPSSPRVHQTLGLAQYQAGDYQAAQSTLQQALSLDNSHALSYFLMGSVLAKLGQREEAARHFEQARALDPKCGLRR